MRLTLGAVVLLSFGVASNAATGPGSLLLMCAEGGTPGCRGTTTAMMATGLFSSVDAIDVVSSVPALGAISGYDKILAWTDSPPSNPSGIGNLLASFYDLGGKRLTIATYSFSSPWTITGTVMTGNYAALTNVGSNGNVSGQIVPTISDPIFNGINFAALTFFQNSNYAHPGLAAGATLLATDGAGINMIARSSNGVVNVNLYPPPISGTNVQFFNLLAQTLTGGGSGGTATVPALGPVAGAFLILGLMAFALYRMRPQAA